MATLAQRRSQARGLASSLRNLCAVNLRGAGDSGHLDAMAAKTSVRRCSSFTGGAAISRLKKEAAVLKAKQELEGAQLVAGIKCIGLTSKQLQELRKALPETSSLIVGKNKLIGKAIEGTRWEGLKPVLKGRNAWLFVRSEQIPAALKPLRGLQKKLSLEEYDLTSGVFEGRFFGPDDFKQLDTMPTRGEIYAMLLSSMLGPATNLMATLQAFSREEAVN